MDFVLVVGVREMGACERFCDEVWYADDNVQKFRPLVSRHRSKFDTSLEV